MIFYLKEIRAYATVKKKEEWGKTATPFIPHKIIEEVVKDSSKNKDVTVTHAQIPTSKRIQNVVIKNSSEKARTNGFDSTFLLIPKKDKGVASAEDINLFIPL